MVLIGFSEILSLTQSIGLVGTLILTLYFSKRQIQALSTDTETRVLNDLGEKFHNMWMLLMEDPSIGRVIENINKYTNQKEVAFSFYVLWMCAHAFAMRQRKVLDDNEWAGWLQWMRNSFRKGTINEIWKQIEPDGKSTYLSLILYYMDELLEERTVKKLIIQEIPLAEIPNELLETKRKIREKYISAKREANRNRKGILLQQVIEEIINLVPGLKVVGRNINNAIEEIDIMVRNHNRRNVWNDFDGVFFIECKNWSKRIRSDELGNFVIKLQNNNIKTGILVAIEGVTGRKSKEGARGQIKTQLVRENVKIIVLEGTDLEDIFNCRNVSDKIDEKYVELYKLRLLIGSITILLVLHINISNFQFATT